jgi:hypothetical protein
MKLFIFPFTRDDLAGFTEIFTVIPLLTEDDYIRVLGHINSWNEGLYTKLRFSTSLFEYTKTIEECDLCIIPFKYNKSDQRITDYCDQAKLYNKSVVCFINDDTSENFEIRSNLYLFRTSTTSKRINKNERVLPVIVPDHFPLHIKLPTSSENRTVAFCGYVGNGRLKTIEQFAKAYNATNFIYRYGFWAPEIKSKQKARQEFYNNLLTGSFSLCMRGNGNFSYRLYEALSFGRIPILIDTDCVLPFSSIIDWSQHIIKVTEDQLCLLPELIAECKISPAKNRELWQTFFSAEGYYNNFIKEL